MVCPQGVLFRGQPEVEEETGEFDDDGNPIIKRRKADDEHLIRQALLESRLIDAVISLPLNVFYGAGVPACLLILRKQRPPKRQDQVLLVYAARHYRELSNQNELRPQDVMRMLVHYHAYGDAAKVPELVKQHSGRIREQIDQRETGRDRTVGGRVPAVRWTSWPSSTPNWPSCEPSLLAQKTKADQKKTETAIHKLESQRAKPAAKLAERDERIAETRRRAEDDRREVAQRGRGTGGAVRRSRRTAQARPRGGSGRDRRERIQPEHSAYVDTFEPEPRVEVHQPGGAGGRPVARSPGSTSRTPPLPPWKTGFAVRLGRTSKPVWPLPSAHWPPAGRVYVMGRRTKLGNCSALRNLSFNWRLVMAPPYILEYVVVHEAVHLAIPDHSQKFWLTVRSHCPAAEKARPWLRQHQQLLMEPLAGLQEDRLPTGE